jgi:hypothetical protein
MKKNGRLLGGRSCMKVSIVGLVIGVVFGAANLTPADTERPSSSA